MGSMDCWAATLAMSLHRASNAGTEHIKRLAAQAGVVIGANGGLPGNNFPNAQRLARRLHLDVYDATARRLQMNVPAYPAVPSFRNLAFPGVEPRTVDVDGRPSLNRLEAMLTPGLVVIMGGFNLSSVGAATDHAIVVFMIEGDGTLAGTQIWFVDPQPGRVDHCNYQFFDDTVMADPRYIFVHRRPAGSA